MRKLVVAIGLIFLSVNGAQTQDQEIHSVLKQRLDIMQPIGTHMRYLGGIARGNAEFDQARVNEIGVEISGFAKVYPTLFADDSQGIAKSRAGPAIFADREGFEATAARLVAAADTLAKLERNDEFGPAFSQLAQVCMACHGTYRLSN